MKILRVIILLGIGVILVSCASSGPKTQYYTLFANTEISVHEIENKTLSLGVGPVVLPEYLEHPGIVSKTQSNRVTVSGYNAWAGDLKENLSRVIAINLSHALVLDHVWAFPWDGRIKPDYQVKLEFEEFSGIRGGAAQVNLRWSVHSRKGHKRLFYGRETIKVQATSNSYNDYVAALNKGLDQLSEKIAEAISLNLNPQ